ncbi:MAG: S-methyl-5-thioribose-1-phosphate isomerase [bacterium]
MSEIRPIAWNSESRMLTLLDQTLLPSREKYIDHTDPEAVAEAISTLVVRGAPAIGCAAAFGLVLASYQYPGTGTRELAAWVADAADLLADSRPTAVNLVWALKRMLGVLKKTKGQDAGRIQSSLEAEAIAIFNEDLASCREIGDIGARLVSENAHIMTYCNAGALATAGYGTALGVIRSAHRMGKVTTVWVCETRPVLQGARLTYWELMKEGIPCTLVTDNIVGSLMSAGDVDLVVVGADRIAANGDVANKIGTYTVAVLAERHNVPFVVAAPLSTIDLSKATGESIPIEERPPEEMSGYGGVVWVPQGARIYNPAFDVTPADLVHAIVTERGIAKAPYSSSLKALFTSGD